MNLPVRFAARCLVRVLALVPLCAAVPAAGQSRIAPDRSAWESGFHVVRPGDTLEGLASRFLGSHLLWKELHALNPEVRDPDLLFPGRRLRIFLDLPTPEPSAQIVATSRKVSELPRPAPWRPANEGDVLLEKDGLRTEKAASARLRFDDGATLTLSEDSLVFIRRQTRSSAPAPKKEIEIQVGQADVESAPGSDRTSSIEVVVGAARAVGTAEAGGALKTRSRKESASAQFMVFDGKSTVAAAGKRVEVPAGSGTTVAPQAPPAPPEPLLPSPAGLEPPADGEFDRSTPRLAWKGVPGAASYAVEICRDPACGSAIEIVRGVTGESMAPTADLTGALYWRVTAVAPSGLDGFPSPARRMVAVDSVAPPVPTLALLSAGGGRLASGACTAAMPTPEVRALDRAGRPAGWTLVVDGEPKSLEAFRSLPLAGRHRVAARTTDERGRSSDSAAIDLTLDGAGPWIGLVAAGAAPIEEAPATKKSRKVEPRAASCDLGLELRIPGSSWNAVPCSAAAPVTSVALSLQGAAAAFELRASRPGTAIGGMPIVPGEPLALAAWDVGCGLTEIELGVDPAGEATGRLALKVAVSDAAGNRRALAWRID